MSLWENIRKFAIPMGDEDEVEEIATSEEKEAAPKFVREEANGNVRKTKVVNLPTGVKQIEIVKLKPAGGDLVKEAREILDLLKRKIAVIVYLAHLDRNEANKMAYMLSGGVYALEGKLRCVTESNDTIVLVPHGVEVTGHVEQEAISGFDFMSGI